MNSMQPSQTDVWQNFFMGFKQYAPEAEAPPIPAVSAKDAEQFFSLFNERYTPFVRSGGAINVWDVAGIGTNEFRNCAVLRWLLDCHGSHGQGPAFMCWFLEAVSSASPLSFAYRDHFPHSGLALAPYRAIAENAYEQDGTDKSRVDIVIESDRFLLFIEVKVYAGETDNQLERYADILRSRAGERPYGLIFLTPDGRAARDESVKDVAYLSWKQLAAAFERGLTLELQDAFWVKTVQQFCQHIRTF